MALGRDEFSASWPCVDTRRKFESEVEKDTPPFISSSFILPLFIGTRSPSVLFCVYFYGFLASALRHTLLILLGFFGVGTRILVWR